MKGNRLILGLLFLFLMGCATAMGTFPQGTGTQVDLSKANYRIVKANAIGESSGFTLLGIIPLAAPRVISAMSDLYSKVGISEGKSHALVNVAQERSSLYLILFSIPKLTIRADVIEFFEDSQKK